MCVRDVSEKKRKDEYFNSSSFRLTLDLGPISFKLQVKLFGGRMALFICHDKSQNAATTKFPIVLDGSNLTLTHPNGLLKDVIGNIRGNIVKTGSRTGWKDFYPNWESYIVDDELHVKATVCVRKTHSFSFALVLHDSL
jgi:hypothetical protein